MAVPGGVWRGNLLDLPGLAPYQRPPFRSLMDNPQPTPGGGNNGPDPFTGGLMGGGGDGREGAPGGTPGGGRGGPSFATAGGAAGTLSGLALSTPGLGAVGSAIGTGFDVSRENDMLSDIGLPRDVSFSPSFVSNMTFGGWGQTPSEQRTEAIGRNAGDINVDKLSSRGDATLAGQEPVTPIEQMLAELAAVAAANGGIGLGGISAGAGGREGTTADGKHAGYGALGTPSSFGFGDLGGGAPSASPGPSLADVAASLANAGDMSFSGQESGGGGGSGNPGTAGGDPGAGGGPSGPWNKGGLIKGRGLMDNVDPPGPDDHITTAERGEFMIKKDSVRHYGPGLLAALNAKKIPKAKLRSLMD